ncbi:MAG: hypothetical protein VKL41_10855, partial [Snowella sp.]|nr:hypothetical protein [Snowella sp.]
MGAFELITDGSTIPVFAWKLKETISDQTNYSLFDLADKLRERGWLVPAYTMTKNRQDLTVQRVVIKEGFSRDMADLLLRDIHSAIAFFSISVSLSVKIIWFPFPSLTDVEEKLA